MPNPQPTKQKTSTYKQAIRIKLSNANELIKKEKKKRNEIMKLEAVNGKGSEPLMLLQRM